MRRRVPSIHGESSENATQLNQQNHPYEKLTDETIEEKEDGYQHGEQERSNIYAWFHDTRQANSDIIFEALSNYHIMLKTEEVYAIKELSEGRAKTIERLNQKGYKPAKDDIRDRAFAKLFHNERQLKHLYSNATHMLNEMRSKRALESDPRLWEMSKYERDLFYISTWAGGPYAYTSQGEVDKSITHEQDQLNRILRQLALVESMMPDYAPVPLDE